MDDITRRYMHDVCIMSSMGKAETAANGWISNRPSVVQRFYRVWSTSDILLVEIDQPSASPNTIFFYLQALVLQAVLVGKRRSNHGLRWWVGRKIIWFHL